MTPHVIWTLRAMATRLGVGEEETVMAYVRRHRDPLRVRALLGKYWIKTSKLDAWRARQQPGNTCVMVETMPAIARRLRVAVRTVRQYARREADPLPVNGLGTARPWIYEDALVDWSDAQDRPAMGAVHGNA